MLDDFMPLVANVLLQVGYAGMNITSKLALESGMKPLVLVAYRQIFATLAIAPLAFAPLPHYYLNYTPTHLLHYHMHQGANGMDLECLKLALNKGGNQNRGAHQKEREKEVLWPLGHSTKPPNHIFPLTSTFPGSFLFLRNKPASIPSNASRNYRNYKDVKFINMKTGIVHGCLFPVDPWTPNIDSQSIASQLFAVSLFSYIGLLYFITKSESAPKLTLVGFYFLLAFADRGKLLVGAFFGTMTVIDIGGGLGIDYDGSKFGNIRGLLFHLCANGSDLVNARKVLGSHAKSGKMVSDPPKFVLKWSVATPIHSPKSKPNSGAQPKDGRDSLATPLGTRTKGLVSPRGHQQGELGYRVLEPKLGDFEGVRAYPKTSFQTLGCWNYFLLYFLFKACELEIYAVRTCSKSTCGIEIMSG
ncbi:hypothetical protein F3Y22_tig00004355pilonHSYRG00030 [Hibiscus syriacus]|uniref:WAT1-related protein n=1 Tax=Hibiscus syriacus TaxID=106335 RepID=A0A6A3CIB3_HIBSY|nr:hypothetical protein F3Y22_tig00004355pilonHSYRG00030 [Hibiscus syriacus]